MKVSSIKWMLLAAGVVASPVWAQAPAEGPSEECLKVLDTLASTIPKEESLAELKRKGVRLRSPLLPSGVSSPSESSGAVVRMKVEFDGRPVSGSTEVLKTLGDAAIAKAVAVAVDNMVFDLSDAKGVTYPFMFSTAYVSCARP